MKKKYSDARRQNEHRCGWVALMGPPNAGKSTLLNTFLGQKLAIVTPKPQTTRNQISGILTEPDAQVIFMDTPGIHQQRGKMNRVLLQTAWQALSGADAILVILDASLYVDRPDYLENDIKPMREAIAAEKRPVFAALNKIDVFHDKSKLLPLLQEVQDIWSSAELFPVSALTGDGLDILLKKIKAVLPAAPAQFPTDQLSTVPMRFMGAEIIREKLFLKLRQELPYHVAVEIEQWSEEPERRLLTIHAVIYVGRSTHKAMVIGKGGQTIKEIGTQARMDIEALTDMKVHLELWVKVREGWTEDLNFLQAISGASEAAEAFPSEEFDRNRD